MGIIFKCLTTRCLHLDLLGSMDLDVFLLALCRFISSRGKPFEIKADRGTNFRAGDRELKQCFQAMEPKLQEHLANQQIATSIHQGLHTLVESGNVKSDQSRLPCE